MGDPFLDAHLHSPGVYTLAGRTPISIRDQVLRAHYLVDRLRHRLGPATQLLVVGAGAAGSTVATLAARLGTQVTVIDANSSPFALQRLCTTRWLDPVQYDWPLSHATRGQWPRVVPSPHVPFGFRADWASRIAAGWATTLNTERLRPNLKVEFRTKLLRMPARTIGTARLHVVTQRAAAVPRARDFDLVVLAVGIARERVDVPLRLLPPVVGSMFQSVPFWSPDRFTDPSFGLPPASAAPVFVSGGGDGALQDYIRLVTGLNSALEVLSRVTRAAGWTEAKLRAEFLHIEEAEQHVMRGLAWNGREQQDHVLLSPLHRLYVALVKKWRASADWAKFAAELRKQTAARPVTRVRLVHSCDHFSACYPLNRLVALLLAEFVEAEHGVAPIESGKRLVAVRLLSGPSHACAAGCWGPPHEVELEDAPSCHAPPAKTLVTRHLAAGIVVRHGTRKWTRAAWRRQVLPMKLP